MGEGKDGIPMIESKPVVTVTGLDHIVLHVSDVERSKRFYCDILGFEIDRDRGWQVFLRAGNNQLGLFALRDGEELNVSNAVNHLALRMGDGTKATVKAALEAHGIHVHGRQGDPDCVYFEDPDGHRLQLYTLEDQQEH
ncbi:MAG: VOC family protein [Chloroflexota bacterium]